MNGNKAIHMESLSRVAKPVALISGVMVLAYATLKAVTPTPSEVTRIQGPLSARDRQERESYSAQTMRFLQINARSNNPIWKLESLPRLQPVSPKDAVPSRAQMELSQRNVELKKRMEERKRRSIIKHSSSSDKL